MRVSHCKRPAPVLGAARWLIAAAIALLGFAAQSQPQSPTANKGQGVADTWQGTLHAGRDYRDVVKISKADDGGYKAVFYFIDQNAEGVTASKVTLDGSTLKMTIPFATYEGKLSPDGKTITGAWTQAISSTFLQNAFTLSWDYLPLAGLAGSGP
jgi:hypothetical protein